VLITYLAMNENYSLTKEIESRKNSFAFALRADNKKLFMEWYRKLINILMQLMLKASHLWLNRYLLH